MNDFFFFARILSLGKDGFVKIDSDEKLTESAFNSGKEVYLGFWGKKKKFIIEDIIKVKNSVFLKFFNFDDERDASTLIGHEIFLSEKDFKSNSGKNFGLRDLIDCHVFRSDKLVGIVRDVFSTPANDVIEIRDENQKEILIPLVDVYFEILDVKNKKIILKPDAGYYDDEN